MFKKWWGKKRGENLHGTAISAIDQTLNATIADTSTDRAPPTADPGFAALAPLPR